MTLYRLAQPDDDMTNAVSDLFVPVAPTPRDLVKVKALRWKDESAGVKYAFTNRQFYGDVFYSIMHDEGSWFSQLHLGEYRRVRISKMFDTPEAAQAACQAHYEQTVYDLLEVR